MGPSALKNGAAARASSQSATTKSAQPARPRALGEEIVKKSAVPAVAGQGWRAEDRRQGTWAPRLAKVQASCSRSSTGKGAMTPRAGGRLSDDEVARDRSWRTSRAAA
jgi:hypothetical protein